METISRYLRHGTAFPEERREQTSVFQLGGYDSPMAAKLTMMGLTVAGVPVTVSTFPGRHNARGHWLGYGHERLAAVLNPETSFELTHPAGFAYRFALAAEECRHLWAIVHANDRPAAIEELQPLAESRFDGPVLVAATQTAAQAITRSPRPTQPR